MTEETTYGQLTQILLELGFVEQAVPDSHIGYQHEPSETVILLAPHSSAETAKPLDVKYVRRVLDERSLLDAKEFDRRVAAKYSSHTA